jgi:RNA polymerase sigma-70 factor (ECF subfamily)
VPEAAVDPDRFRPEDDDRYPGHWLAPPRELPEERLLAAETRELITAAIDALPATQAAVIRLRDVDGWSSEEVRNALDISDVNQRVLLHRARAKVRQALEDYLAPV